MLYGRAQDVETGEWYYEKGESVPLVIGALFGYGSPIQVGDTHTGDHPIKGVSPGTLFEIFDNPNYEGERVLCLEVVLTTRLL